MKDLSHLYTVSFYRDSDNFYSVLGLKIRFLVRVRVKVKSSGR